MTIEAEGVAWEEVSASLRNGESPHFDGVEITPQVGLVPLGRNPSTGWWEFWHVLSGERPLRETGRYVLNEHSGMVLVLLPGGEFVMGAQGVDPTKANFDERAESKEGPPRAVRLAPFFISAYEMTQAQWRRSAGSNPSYYSWENGWKERGGTDPVEQVSYDDCVVTLRQLGLRLPTEAQWEYAARAGTSTPWSTGPDPLSLMGYANIGDARSQAAHGADYIPEAGFDDDFVVHCAVGSLEPNAAGLYDTHGNVAEWVADRAATYAVVPRQGDGLRQVDSGEMRAYRGGHAEWPAVFARSSDRRFAAPGNKVSTLGVRAARPLVLDAEQGRRDRGRPR
jgi:formylglycine-generating enzyme required for sulfatase activity